MSNSSCGDGNADLHRKAALIQMILSEQQVDLWKLRELALTEGGLVNDSLRRRAWPKLVGLVEHEVIPSASSDLPPGTPLISNKTKDQTTRPPRPPRPPRLPSSSSLLKTEELSKSITTSTSTSSYNNNNSNNNTSTMDTNTTIPLSLDADQIDRDVARCTWHLLTGSQRSRRMQMESKHRRRMAALLKKKQRRLGQFLNITLLRASLLSQQEESGGKTADFSSSGRLFYYQGYHDIASIFLSVLGGGGGNTSTVTVSPLSVLQSSSAMDPYSIQLSTAASSIGLDVPSAVLSQVSQSHFRDAMQPNFVPLQTAIRLIIMPLICYFDSELHDFLEQVDMEPFFALSWIITWFAHDVRDTDLVKRLFDAFIVSHPLLPLYTAVAMVCHPHNRHELLHNLEVDPQERNSPNGGIDFAIVHSALSNLPKNSSMVGWKYRPGGDGYISGDDTDTDSVTSMDVTAMIQMDVSMEKEDNEAQSLVSSQVSLGSSVKAPFQEILDLALTYMRAMPPRKLSQLAGRYFGKEMVHTMLHPSAAYSSSAMKIAMLNAHPPSWGLISNTPADWVLRAQRQYSATGKVRRGRAVRRNSGSSVCSNSSNGSVRRSGRASRSSSRTPGGEPNDDNEDDVEDDTENAESTNNDKDMNNTIAAAITTMTTTTEEELQNYLRTSDKALAVIACGYGPGDEEEIRQRQRKRRLLFWAGVAVAVLAVAVGMHMLAGARSTTTSNESDATCAASTAATMGGNSNNTTTTSSTKSKTSSHSSASTTTTTIKSESTATSTQSTMVTREATTKTSSDTAASKVSSTSSPVSRSATASVNNIPEINPVSAATIITKSVIKPITTSTTVTAVEPAAKPATNTATPLSSIVQIASVADELIEPPKNIPVLEPKEIAPSRGIVDSVREEPVPVNAMKNGDITPAKAARDPDSKIIRASSSTVDHIIKTMLPCPSINRMVRRHIHTFGKKFVGSFLHSVRMKFNMGQRKQQSSM